MNKKFLLFIFFLSFIFFNVKSEELDSLHNTDVELGLDLLSLEDEIGQCSIDNLEIIPGEHSHFSLKEKLELLKFQKIKTS